MLVSQYQEAHLREELKQLLDSDYWKYLSGDTRENILTMLAEYQSEEMRSPENSYGIWKGGQN